MTKNTNPLPKVGDVVTEGMGLYRVRAIADDGTLQVVSTTSGLGLWIDWHESFYHDHSNVWRVCS